MKKFIILTTQRSGSTWLTDLLNNHPHVRCYSELFLNRDRPNEIKPWHQEADPNDFFYSYKKNSKIPRPFSTFKYLYGLEKNMTTEALDSN
jgi:LPS sulfotransferase NodH